MEHNMNFQCKSCGANMVYSPERQALYCPHCDGGKYVEQKGNGSLTSCPSCGGDLNAGDFASTTQCPFCGTNIILDERISGQYRPSQVLPFVLSKEDAIEALEEEFEGRKFTPSSFLSEKTLVDMKGYYVPFFIYDYHVDSKYVGEAVKMRSWREGNYDCTETSYYKLYRELKVDYDNVPVDASISMNDDTMDLLEPFDYELLTDFDPTVMSGFLGEIYNLSADELAERAEEKISDSADTIMKESMTNYTLRKAEVDNVSMERGETEFVLLPVWQYTYKHAGKEFVFYINGQSGKVVGKTPIDAGKVALYGITCAALWGLTLDAIVGLLSGLFL